MRHQTLRRAREEDREAMLRLWERSVRATHHFLSGADVDELLPHVARELGDDAIDWWVVTTDERGVVAFLAYVPGVIDGLFVDPEHQGRGAGTLLVDHALEMSAGQLRVEVNEQNAAARGFYESAGFRVVGRSPVDSAGRPFPLLQMIRPA